MMNAWQVIAGTLASGALAAAGAGVYHAVLQGWRHLEQIRTEVARERNERALLKQSLQTGQLTIARQEWELTQGRVDRARLIYPDGTGQFPLIMIDSKTVYDPTLAALAHVGEGLKNVDPRLAVPEQRRRLYAAMSGLGAPAARAAIESESNGDAVTWPSRVTLAGLVDKYHLTPDYHNIVVGETYTNGQWAPVMVDLQQAVHVLVSGASGFGKSTLMTAIGKQLVMSGNDVCAIDYGAGTFSEIESHLLYPLADDESLTLALFKVLTDIMLERKARFRACPGARDLTSYNRLSGESLRTITVLVDESSVLFDKNSQLKQAVTTLSQMSRKFGLGLVMAGTDFLASTIPTSATGNFGARCGFHLRPSLSQSLLYCRDAADLRHRGRLLLALPGVPNLTELQAPVVESWDNLPEPRHQEPLQPVEVEPVTTGRRAKPVDPEVMDKIAALHSQGETVTAIARAIFGHGSSYYIHKVRDILSDINDNNGAGGT